MTLGGSQWLVLPSAGNCSQITDRVSLKAREEYFAMILNDFCREIGVLINDR